MKCFQCDADFNAFICQDCGTQLSYNNQDEQYKMWIDLNYRYIMRKEQNEITLIDMIQNLTHKIVEYKQIIDQLQEQLNNSDSSNDDDEFESAEEVDS